MRRPKRLNNVQGFTIVEVLIVLAIAGLILLIVLQAIPALDRSSRNNLRRQDATLILQAVSKYELNNSGNFPPQCDASNPCYSAVSGSPNDNFLRFDRSKLAFYTDNSAIRLYPQSTSTSSSVSNTSDVDHIYIFNYLKCSPNVTGQPASQGAGYNDVVALFSVETGGGSALQCMQL